jgi:fructose/tagatose bisphosphate aldolase
LNFLFFFKGGEEDGVNNEAVDPEKLYTSPEQVFAVYQALSKIGDMFSIAAAFGNVHGVYKPGNVTLQPERLGKHQAYAKEKLGCESDLPIFLVMHGGSGSTDQEIATAVKVCIFMAYRKFRYFFFEIKFLTHFFQTLCACLTERCCQDEH